MTDEELDRMEQAARRPSGVSLKDVVRLVEELRRVRTAGAPRKPAEQLSFDAAQEEDEPAPRRNALRAVPTPPAHMRMVNTNVRLREDQWAWLRREAMERALRRPGSRGDASAVLRELLDAYIAQRGAA